jgi:prepilin-type processing-associated H-X9-DG protein
LVELLVVIAIIGVLVGLLLPAVQAAREAARQSSCRNNLKQIGTAILNFESSKRAIPAGFSYFTDADAPSWGWATFILPYLERADLYDGLQPETRRLSAVYTASASAADRALLQTNLPTYRCASDTAPALNTLLRFGGSNHFPIATSNYVGSAGAQLITGSYNAPHNDVDCGGAFFGMRDSKSPAPGKGPLGLRLEQVADGTSKTIAVGERSAFNYAAVWAGVGTSGSYANEFTARTVGRPQFPMNFEFRTAGAPENHGKGFSSPHAGSVQFLFLDGSVALVRDSLTGIQLGYLANRQDGVTFSLP